MLVTFVAKYWKILAILVIAIASFCAGYKLMPTKIVEKEKIVYKNQTVTDTTKKTKTIITEKPDGTIVTEIVEDTDTHSTTNTTTVNEKEKIVSQEKSKFMLGAQVSPDNILDPLKNQTYTAIIGVRALGPVWVNGSYNFNRNEAGIGVHVEF